MLDYWQEVGLLSKVMYLEGLSFMPHPGDVGSQGVKYGSHPGSASWNNGQSMELG